MRRSIRPALVCGALALASVGACGQDETLVDPVALADAAPPDAGVDVVEAAPPAVEASAPEAQTVKRTIIERNPFGDVAASDNLLWDGDFEWDTAFADSYGWVPAGFLFQPIGTFSQIHIGYVCHSGMKCGYLTAGQEFGAIGVAPGHAPVEASIWVKPPTADCSDVAVDLFGCTDSSEPEVPLLDDDGKPDADGWCMLHATAAERTHATCLMVSAHFPDGEALMDDAVVRAAPADTKSLRALRGTSRSVSARDHAAMAELRTTIARVLQPRTPPPNAAQTAFERWRRSIR